MPYFFLHNFACWNLIWLLIILWNAFLFHCFYSFIIHAFILKLLNSLFLLLAFFLRCDLYFIVLVLFFLFQFCRQSNYVLFAQSIFSFVSSVKHAWRKAQNALLFEFSMLYGGELHSTGGWMFSVFVTRHFLIAAGVETWLQTEDYLGHAPATMGLLQKGTMYLWCLNILMDNAALIGCQNNERSSIFQGTSIHI